MPKWIHDCDKCIYLGTIFKEFDLYICRDNKFPDLDSYLIRYGDEGSEYLSIHVSVEDRKKVKNSISGLNDEEVEIIALMRNSYCFFLNNLEKL